MKEHPDTPDDLYPFAEALVRKMNPPGWDEHRKEDAIQELYLAGWKVYRETKNIGFAKHRMASRKHNLLRDYYSEDTHEPKASTPYIDTEAEQENEVCGEESTRAWKQPNKRATLRGDPAVEVMMQDYLDNMPKRRRDVCMLWMAAYTVD
jgi:hypothetical protein